MTQAPVNMTYIGAGPLNWVSKLMAGLADALRGADVVVASILPREFDDMAQDIDIPARYGTTQAVGDMGGLGGSMRALRAIRVMVPIAHAIRDHAPKEWVRNLTNPMNVLTGAISRAFREIRLWGANRGMTPLRHRVAGSANRIVETSAVFSSLGSTPMVAGGLPEAVPEMTAHHLPSKLQGEVA